MGSFSRPHTKSERQEDRQTEPEEQMERETLRDDPNDPNDPNHVIPHSWTAPPWRRQAMSKTQGIEYAITELN
jgi:hypothetical protein